MFLVLFAAIALGALHLIVGRFQVSWLPRAYWSSAAAGVAVAYVFIHLFPALESRAAAIEEAGILVALDVRHVLYVAALLGFVGFYGVERVARTSHDDTGERPHGRAFWLHIASFGLYNAFIGYVLHEQRAAGLSELLLFLVAIGLHLAIIEYGLQHDHEGRYRGLGQWLLGSAVVLGAGVGFIVAPGPLATSLFFAVLAGGIVLNVIKEELPTDRDGRFWPFALGAGVYMIFLLVV